MISIVLSERDFDYEIQALALSFFPGERSEVCLWEDLAEMEGSGIAIREINVENEYGVGVQGQFPKRKFEIVSGLSGQSHTDEIWIFIGMTQTEISVAVRAGGSPVYSGSTAISGKEDWHKKEGKKAHPYRTEYKNELKKLLFTLLQDIPEEYLTSARKRRIPLWGTMTGVRPTKIFMNQWLSGASLEQICHDMRETYRCSSEKIALGLQIAQKEAALLEAIPCAEGYSLYISIPFCPTTCLYCSFPSYPLEQFGHLAEQYLQALKTEITAIADVVGDRPLTSIYIGGGTPTTLSAGQLRELILYVKNSFPASGLCEFTVEAGRPDSITREKLLVLREQGVDRISVNPQTMQQKTLDLIGRKHTVEDTIETFQLARELGFTNINMDLIIGLPGETVSDFRDTLRQIQVLDPDSLTIHSLVIKRASRLRSVLEEQAVDAGMSLEELEFGRGEQLEQMLRLGEEFAMEQGYEPYYMYRQKNSAGHAGSTGQENIGYARPGKECLYNILIMEEMQTIAAAGAGASTKLYHADLGQVSRIENVKSITDYIDRVEEMAARKYKLLQDAIR